MARVIESEIETRRLRRVEYEHLVDPGMVEGERLELLDGLLVVREPRRSAREPHGVRFARTKLLRPPATVTARAAPAARIPVADLLL